MAFLAHHEHGAHGLIGGIKLPAHLKLLRKLRELCSKNGLRTVRTHKLHAHEKQLSFVVVELRGFVNVASAHEQKARDRVNDARAVDTCDGEDVGGRQESLKAGGTYEVDLHTNLDMHTNHGHPPIMDTNIHLTLASRAIFGSNSRTCLQN